MHFPDFGAWAILIAAAARVGSFTAVAHELAISKPTISKAITRLEESMGTRSCFAGPPIVWLGNSHAFQDDQ